MTIDYLLIGHISLDVSPPEGYRLGGTVSFGSMVARALGFTPGIVTSAANDALPYLEQLGDTPIHRIEAEHSTLFENTYTEKGRTQRAYSRAKTIKAKHVPAEWRSPRIVHLAPILDEVDSSLVEIFPDSLIIATPQGWMRRVTRKQTVKFKKWEQADEVLPRLSALILSMEDIRNNQKRLRWLVERAPLVVVTRSSEGCTLYIEGKPHEIPTAPQPEVDPTGAGDVFAASFAAHYLETSDPFRAAGFANELASYSVTQPGIKGIPGPQIVEHARNTH